MSDSAAIVRPAPATEAHSKPARNSILRHALYVVADNPVTGIAFALFLLIALCALFGPLVVPHDPLASDTAAALHPPSLAHWFGTDQLGRDIFSRVVVATRLYFTIGSTSLGAMGYSPSTSVATAQTATPIHGRALAGLNARCSGTPVVRAYIARTTLK